ncbi:OLC1v1034301C1 [Oldenlandia corymbosa var. corymbosa]|uniref:OLC1v1034301C1 n=1 Tax=Oldenlandia corymbosa var. corymbosa TaxID=529605 RepID=A0AAV1CQ70_OLDCO|nr:OLC1v1034301C1 [Oldenlandia corymbosa var. corymbosa]
MDSNLTADEDHPDHAIQIWEVNQDRLALMQKKISAAPGILSKSAGRSSCCIFRVPKSLNDINGEHYQPRIVSIGPYHHGNPQLAMIEEHKWRFLGILSKRTENKGLKLEDYLKAVQPLEAEARERYAEGFQFNKDEFIEMLVLDGCFIIELFRKFEGVVKYEPDDPLFSMSWVLSFLLRDLIRLENQIPFFILRRLFELTQMPDEESGPSLGRLTLNFFNNALERPEESLDQYSNIDGKHILDFLRSSFIPPEHKEPKPGKFSNVHVIQCISDLRRAGIDLKPGKQDSFLAVQFRHGVIEMPTIALDDFMSSFLLNCVAYEQCHGSSSKHMTTYVTLLDCLINTARDIQFLCDRNIIENYFGTDAEIARFVNNMGKDVSLDNDMCYLSGLFNEVNQYYRSNWHVTLASFKNTYFKTPWSFISAVAAFVLLVLTVLQTLYTILSYVNPK